MGIIKKLEAKASYLVSASKVLKRKTLKFSFIKQLQLIVLGFLQIFAVLKKNFKNY
jgi:hypothetical protein